MTTSTPTTSTMSVASARHSHAYEIEFSQPIVLRTDPASKKGYEVVGAKVEFWEYVDGPEPAEHWQVSVKVVGWKLLQSGKRDGRQYHPEAVYAFKHPNGVIDGQLRDLEESVLRFAAGQGGFDLASVER